MSPEQAHDRPRRVETAQYVAFARTWQVLARQSDLPKPLLQQRLEEFFRWLCVRVGPAVALEVGAHEATFSRWARGALPEARVQALEANPHVHAKYADEVTAAGVDYRNVAVAPTTGQIELNLPLEVDGKPRALDSRMASIAVHTQQGDATTVTVPSVRLDDLVELGAGDRVVAWIDVEGANDAVLQSGPELFRRVDALFIEVENRPTWEGQWLDTDVAHHLARHGLVPIARDLQKPYQYNVVYARARLVQRSGVMRRAAKVLLG